MRKNKDIDDRALLPLKKEDRLDFSRKNCNDVFFAVLFISHIGLLLSMTFKYGFQIQWAENNSADLFACVGCMIITGVAGGYFYVRTLKYCAPCILQTVLILQPIVGLATAFFMFWIGSTILGVLFVFASLFLFWYYFAIQSRIQFSVVLIEIASEIVTKYPATLYLAVGCVGIQILLVLVWGVAVFGYYQALPLLEDGIKSSINPGMVFIFVVSIYWSLETTRFLLYCTVCGVTASYFYTPGMPDPTMHSFQRAATTSFGSVCFGALVISILRGMETILRSVVNTEQDNACAVVVSCCALFLLDCIDQLAEYLNQLGFVYVAVYGHSYMKACKRVYNLIVDTGFESIIQYDLTNSAMFAGSLLTGLLTCALTGYIARFHSIGEVREHYAILAALGLVLGFGFSWLVTQTLVAAINTVFVVWAEDPETLFIFRMQQGLKLVEATKHIPQLTLKDTRHLNVISSKVKSLPSSEALEEETRSTPLV